MASDRPEPQLPESDADTKPPVAPAVTPVDGAAQEEAGKVREESGGYD